MPNSECDSALISALNQLRSKLLNLTGKNQLINFKHTTGQSLQFIEGSPIAIARQLFETCNESRINILGLPDPKKADWVNCNGRQQRPEPRDWAKSKGFSISFEIATKGKDSKKFNPRTLMYTDSLAVHCRTIERDARLAIEETGANMLFLVLGFLEFPDQRNSDRIFSAPLILVPVTLQRKESAGIQQFSLQYAGDDISENIPLRKKLEGDFGLFLPEFSSDQIDVMSYFRKIRNIIKNQPRFAIKSRTSLCLLSITNMLLYRDLDPANWSRNSDVNSLINHPIIRQVFGGKVEEGRVNLGLAKEHNVEEAPGANVPLVYDADSSQHRALIDVLCLKKNLVIEGPPGTGKSQTITNIIAACLADGKKVLFVTEKMAALEVVKDRLSKAGLDPFVLELHSNKSSKKRLLDDIRKRVDFKPDIPIRLPRLLQQLEAYRQDLKSHADLINSVACNALGLTIYQIIGRAEMYRQKLSRVSSTLIQINLENATQISAVELDRRLNCLKHLGICYKNLGNFHVDCAFWGFNPELLVPGEEDKIAQLFGTAEIWGLALVKAVKHLSQVFGGRLQNLSHTVCCEQTIVLKHLLDSVNPQLPLHLIPIFFENDETGTKAFKDIDEFNKLVKQFHNLEGAVNKAFELESNITKSGLDDLKKLICLGESLGAELGNLNDLKELHQQLIDSIGNFSTAHINLIDFFRNKNLPYDRSREKLEQLFNFIELVWSAPEQLFYLQTEGLTLDDAVQEFEKLLALQSKLTNLEVSLSAILYLDQLPPKADLQQAILNFRKGNTWYRIFQANWRQAIGLHKSLHRSKHSIPVKLRLKQLEQIQEIILLKEQWEASPAWKKYLDLSIPATSTPLEGYLELARWNQNIRIALENIQVGTFNLIKANSDQARAIRREFRSIRWEFSTAIAALKKIDANLNWTNKFGRTLTVDKVIEKANEFTVTLKYCLEWLEFAARGQATFSQLIAGCDAALERSRLKSLIQSKTYIKSLMADFYKGVDTDCSAALEVLSLGQSIDKLSALPQVKHKLRNGHLLEVCSVLIKALEDVSYGLQQVDNLVSSLSQFGKFELEKWTGTSADKDLETFVEALHSAIKKAIRYKSLLIPWSQYQNERTEASKLSLIPFINLLEESSLKPNELADAYSHCIFFAITRDAFRNIPHLRRFSGLKHNQIRNEFKRIDKEIITLRGRAIAYECKRRAIPPNGERGIRVDERTEMVLLDHLMPQQRPRMAIRKILTRACDSIQALKPCFMMGPQAVAQYLNPNYIKFDLVIMDEASQIKPEEALGSIARGDQLVVVGDPNQLPPTSFFSCNTIDEGAGEEMFSTTDSESILDVCSSHFRPTRSLHWHYRSQHHSLIAFSNQNFYGGNLVVFPSPYSRGNKLGLRAVYLANATYENQINSSEAKRVVDAVLEHIITRPQDSLGVVTLNIKQRNLIAKLLEEKIKTVPSADDYHVYWRNKGYPLFIKNLENVQGDERDAIIISITFGKLPGSNVVRQNFGPISRHNGWRRLNVLFTRAKKSLAIFTSLRPEDILIDKRTPKGTKILKDYLEFVRSGSLTLTEETNRAPDSDFEISVIATLKQQGYEVTPQLGVAGYRIDIAVKHPDWPGSYLAAIECDGASYHSETSVRDRDRIRQEILESVGWRGRIWRIWSTDWFREPTQETDKLIGFLKDLRSSWKPEHDALQGWIEEGQGSASETVICTDCTDQKSTI